MLLLILLTGFSAFDDYRYNTGTGNAERQFNHHQKPAVLPAQYQPQYQPSQPIATVRTQKPSPRIAGGKKKPQTEMVPKAVLVEKEQELEERSQTVEVFYNANFLGFNHFARGFP